MTRRAKLNKLIELKGSLFNEMDEIQKQNKKKKGLWGECINKRKYWANVLRKEMMGSM
jgi:hypothetical protein